VVQANIFVSTIIDTAAHPVGTSERVIFAQIQVLNFTIPDHHIGIKLGVGVRVIVAKAPVDACVLGEFS
jgi:hypothetical protein